MSGMWTPGPWRFCGASRGGCQCRTVWSISADCIVARAITERESHGEGAPAHEAAANVHLIAAAPQLFIALAEARGWLQKDTPQATRDAIETALAAASPE